MTKIAQIISTETFKGIVFKKKQHECTNKFGNLLYDITDSYHPCAKTWLNLPLIFNIEIKKGSKVQTTEFGLSDYINIRGFGVLKFISFCQ